MVYLNFVKKAKEQDARNVFEKYNGCLDIIPEEIKPFFCEYNPVRLVIDDDGIDICFASVEKLYELQKNYAYIGAQLIFATCNGDPIFYNDSKIYTCPHGVQTPEWEQLADNFMEYLDSII